MKNLVPTYKVETDDFKVEYEVLSPIDIEDTKNPERRKIVLEMQNLDNQINAIEAEINKMDVEIDRLTNHTDGIDYAISVTCGIITGIIDSLFVGEWDFKKAKAISNKEINEKILKFANKDPRYSEFLSNKIKNKDPNRLDNAIEFLEKTYKLPGDGSYKQFKNIGITDSTHHLDDFCHHPTLIGLLCCILVQFTGNATYRSSTGAIIKTPVEVNDYGKFVSDNNWGKVFAGIINWFFNLVQTIKNRKGHLLSDMAGSSSSVGKGNEGAGLPGSFLSLAKELSALPCFADTNFAENLRKAFQNGIGTGKSQLDLGAFNSLFAGASSKVDIRTENAVKHELKRQAVPIIINEIFVRALYFVRRFIWEMKEKSSILDIDWKKTIPLKNRTIVRMLTIATGTFTAVDVADAGIRAIVKSGGINPETLANFILRVNFVGIGRFAIAIVTDAGMGVKRNHLMKERIGALSQQMALLNAKVSYKCAEVCIVESDVLEQQKQMWISAQNTEETLNAIYEQTKDNMYFFYDSLVEIQQNYEMISKYRNSIEEHNKGLKKDIINICKWGKK